MISSDCLSGFIGDILSKGAELDFAVLNGVNSLPRGIRAPSRVEITGYGGRVLLALRLNRSCVLHDLDAHE